jgi:hypothetical protein
MGGTDLQALATAVTRASPEIVTRAQELMK